VEPLFANSNFLFVFSLTHFLGTQLQRKKVKGVAMIAYSDPILVALSVIVAIFGSLTALLISSDYEKRLNIGGYAGCLACYGGIVMGGSIWSMHFIAMLALHLPVTISYEPWQTALSLALPIFVTGLGFRIVGRNLYGKFSVPVGGLLMGLAISGMHYLGMAAIRGCNVDHDASGVALAIAIAIGAATVALWFVFRKRSALETVVGSVVLGLAIAGMHYTAMFATSFAPLDVQLELAVPVMAQSTLAYAIAVAMIIICCANFIVLAFAKQSTEQAA
jgi:NO-binding membrane sensor protein with MHYT domain